MPPGRRRDPAIDDAVRRAVLSLLRDGGYDAVSFQQVARLAGVGQPTVYRRWPTKPALVEAAIFAANDWTPPPPSRNLRADLRSLGEAVIDGLAEPAIRAAVPGLLAAYQQDKAAHTRLRAWAEAPVRQAFDATVTASSTASPTARDTAFDAYLSALIGVALTRTPPQARRSVSGIVNVVAAFLEDGQKQRPDDENA